MVFYGVEGAGVGNGMTVNSAISTVPFMVHVESSKVSGVMDSLALLGVMDDTQRAAVSKGSTGIIAVSSISSASEGADGIMDISMLGCEQLEILADIASGTAVFVEDRKYLDSVSKMMTVSIDGGKRKINVIITSFVK